ncbi:hypothetical protein [Mycoplasma sp. 1654_15]|uniref:hypothetical protein n=1 Tax=Mycoplasma sp. 1654_15 TaxID=2725994 RepID=UPI0020C41751|nr:hypothetical protein [Mycoplasma sp. 1654_15]
MVKNNLWKEFEEFEENKGIKISKFDYFYNGSILLSIFKKNKLTDFVSNETHSLKEINLFINDFRLKDYKINYFEEIKKIYKNLFVMTITSSVLLLGTWIFGTFVILETVLQFFIFDFVEASDGSILEFYLESQSFSIILILFLLFLVCFWILNFTHFRKYLIIYYRIFTIALSNFEEIENFEENEDFKNSLYVCIKQKNNIWRPLDLNSTYN